MRSCLLLLFLSVSLFTAAQENLLTANINKLTKAMESADKQALDSLLSDRLSYGHSDGKVEDKKAFITHLESGAYDFVKITISDQAITVSANTAIVRHTLSASTNDNGKPGQVKLHVMQVWQKHKGKWLLLARQATKI